MDDKTLKEARKIVGQYIKAQRQELGMSRRAVADHCHLHGTQVAGMEDGTINYTIDTLMRVAHGMNCQLFIELRPKATDRDNHDWETLQA